MLVYHGTTLEIRNPQILANEVGRDFGFAFYSTDIKEQAERWAVRRAKVQTRLNRKKEQAVVNVYEWSESHSLKEKIFRDASMDWLDMVVQCRSDIRYCHDYDIVTGKIANDNVGETHFLHQHGERWNGHQILAVCDGTFRGGSGVERLYPREL